CPADPLATRAFIDNEVLDRARWPAQRHEIEAFERRVCVADDLARLLGDEDDGSGVVKLTADEMRVPRGDVGRRGKEAQRIEFVMLRNERCAEAADGLEIGRNRGPDSNPPHYLMPIRGSCGRNRW